MCRILLTITILLVSHAACATSNLDSLCAVWQDENRDNISRVEAYYQYIRNGFLKSNPDSVPFLVEDLHSFAMSCDCREAESCAYNIEAYLNYLKGNNREAVYQYEQALKINTEIEYKLGIAESLHGIGLMYYTNIYYTNEKNSLPIALEYYEKSLEISKELGHKELMSSTLNNMGLIYSAQHDYDRALEFMNRSLKLSEALDDKHGAAHRLINIGDIYLSQENYTLALEYSQKALDLRREIGNTMTISHTLVTIGRIYNLLGNYDMSIDFCEQSLKAAEETNVWASQKNACQCLYDSYKAIGKSEEALYYIEKVQVLSDTLKLKGTAQKLQEMEFAKQAFVDSIAKAAEARLVQDAHEEEIRKNKEARNMIAGAGLLIFILAGGLFARMRHIRRSKAALQAEKERSENLLLNILPADIAAELKKNGKADARDFEMVSILFTDFEDFTEQSAKLSASDLVKEINACFEAFDGIVEKYGIEKIKTIGDAYMAAGGIPTPSDDSLKNTVLAALEMQDFISKRKAEMDAAGKPAFEMRVGVHTGPVVAGIVGIKKFQYDIWGDTVNTASRLESSGKIGKVNISQVSYQLLRNDALFSFESRGKIEAKGKGEIEMYFVSRT